MKKIYQLMIAGVIALGITFLTPTMHAQNVKDEIKSNFDYENAIIAQNVVKTNETEKEIYTIFYKDSVLGVLTDQTKLNRLMDTVYHSRYEADFPDTKLGLGEDIHVSQSLSMFEYEDKDEEILTYLDQNDLFSVEANKIEFSNGAVLYVKNIEDFTEARDEFALNFVDKESYDLLKNNQTTPELAANQYGTRVVSAKYKETATISRGLAPESRIAKTKNDVLMYLSYGYDSKEETYTTIAGDTVAGVAWVKGISVQHLLSINSDKLISETQLLPAGMVLNVTPLNSPITFEVIKDHKETKPIDPGETEIIRDDTLRENMQVTVQEAEYGVANVINRESIINGTSIGGQEISSSVIKEPVKEILKLGTKVEPRIGSGKFGWPVHNPSISCAQGCYAGHEGTDIQDRYNKYGKVLASDRGVVEMNSYNQWNGYFYVINHNNGYWTYYGHMARPGFFPVGTVVAKGEEIGDIGMTGLASGPHVHFEIRNQGGILGNSLPFSQFFH